MNRRIARQPADSGWLIIHDLNQKIESSPVSSVLEVLVSITDSQAAHLYWMDPAAYELRLVSASSTSEECRIPRVCRQFHPAAQRWLDELQPAGVATAGEANFAWFPETVAPEIASLLVFPLRAEQKPTGVLTFSRRSARVYGEVEIEKVVKLSDALVAAMREHERRREVELLREKLRSARQVNNELEKRLAVRKLVERAKGLLQTHYKWTEEEAYYHLRRTSRQQRTPMAVIAQRTIDFIAASEMDNERLTA